MEKMMKRAGKVKAKSIKKTLLVGMVGLTVTVSLLCGAVTGTILYQNSYKSMGDEVTLASKSYSQAVQNNIGIYKISIEQIAMNETLTNTDLSATTRKIMEEGLAKQYGFLTVNIADATGKTDVDGVNIIDREYFKQAMGGKTYISSPLVSKIDSTTVLYVAAKINQPNGFKGIVFASVSSDTFSSMVDNAIVGQTGYSFITDKTGTVIAHKDRSAVSSFTNYLEKAKKDSSLSELANVTQNMMKGKTGGQEFKIGGIPSYVAYCPIQGTDGWSLAVTAKTSEMMSDFYIAIWITIGLMLLFMILSAIFSFRIANPIVKPIVNLVKRIELLAEGDLHSEVPLVNTQDEIGILSRSFSSTINTLNDYIGEIAVVLDSLSEGDCTIETQQDYKGDFVWIKTALDATISNLNNMFTRIRQSADQVANGSEQVSSAAQALSQGATEQASSIEELSASITEIANEVNKNASNSAQANQLSLAASTEVERGNEHMKQMLSAMSNISEASSLIGRIIKTIDDIAFQTNILALNAAVEAARAGSAGRGFAVVADEVRNLASKSAKAAKNTTGLIEDSMRAVENGTRIASETANSLSSIIVGVKKATGLIGEISAASNDQATSINQVMLGVDQISAVVQTNSATSEESAATSEELSNQAQIMKNILSSLKLKEVSDADNHSVTPAQTKESRFVVPSVDGQEPSKY
jgi:methyl-accepting chemotaxis protein